MSMVMTAVYNPVIPARTLAAVWVFLLCRTSQVMIIRVKRMLNEIETKKYGRLKWMLTAFQVPLSGCQVRWRNRIPIATLRTLARSAIASLQKPRMRTHRANIHEAGEGDDPKVHGANQVVTVELGGKLELDIWAKSNKEPTIRPSANQLFKRNIG